MATGSYVGAVVIVERVDLGRVGGWGEHILKSDVVVQVYMHRAEGV